MLDLGTDFDDRLLSRFYSDVMEESFAPAELVSLDSLRAGINAGGDAAVLTVLALGPGQEVLGGMVGERYPGSGVLLLAYIAVRPEGRGRGVGTRLLAHADESWYSKLRPNLALGEVEHPDFHPASSFGDPAARLRLYERVGAKLLGVPYFQPEVRQGAGRVYDMLLLAFHVEPSVRNVGAEGATVDGTVVRDFLDEYFALCEDPAVVTDDREYLRLRSQVDPAGVPLLPLRRYRDVPGFHGRERSLREPPR